MECQMDKRCSNCQYSGVQMTFFDEDILWCFEKDKEASGGKCCKKFKPIELEVTI